MASLKTYVLCFVVGGLFAMVGQVISMLVVALFGSDFPFIAQLTLIGLGVVAFVLYLTGIHQKLAAVSGAGMILPFNGLAGTVASIHEGVTNETGKSSKGAWASAKLIIKVVGTGGLICAAIGVIAFFALPAAGPPAAAAEQPLLMVFVQAFALGGVICLIFQLAMQVTKLPVPTLLICGLAIGGLITPFGIADALVAWGGTGWSIMVVGAGQAICATTQVALMGNVIPLLSIIGVIVILTLIGIVSGALHRAMHKGDAKAAPASQSNDK